MSLVQGITVVDKWKLEQVVIKSVVIRATGIVTHTLGKHLQELEMEKKLPVMQNVCSVRCTEYHKTAFLLSIISSELKYMRSQYTSEKTETMKTMMMISMHI